MSFRTIYGYSKSDLPDRIQRRIVDNDNDCWLWDARRKDGYTQVSYKGDKWLVHRLTYTLMVGEIPEGLQIDHLCRTRHCVNPAHLEAVTPLENTSRSLGNNSKTCCPKGHEYTAENTINYDSRRHRECKTCKYARNAAYDAARGYFRPSRQKKAA